MCEVVVASSKKRVASAHTHSRLATPHALDVVQIVRALPPCRNLGMADVPKSVPFRTLEIKSLVFDA